jgi:ABC-type amino acid transport substrate-binding protein
MPWAGERSADARLGRMRFPRLLIAALALAATLTACSGDESEPKNDDPSATSPAADDPNAPGAEGSCKVQVEVTGAATASWEGRATVRVGDADGPAAVYQATKGDDLLMAYAEGPDFPPSVTVTVGEQTFANRPGSAEGLDIRGDRTGAEVDITALDVKGAEAQVSATFECKRKKDKS